MRGGRAGCVRKRGELDHGLDEGMVRLRRGRIEAGDDHAVANTEGLELHNRGVRTDPGHWVAPRDPEGRAVVSDGVVEAAACDGRGRVAALVDGGERAIDRRAAKERRHRTVCRGLARLRSNEGLGDRLFLLHHVGVSEAAALLGGSNLKELLQCLCARLQSDDDTAAGERTGGAHCRVVVDKGRKSQVRRLSIRGRYEHRRP